MKNALMSYGSSDKGSVEGKVLLDKIVTVNGKEYKHKKITKRNWMTKIHLDFIGSLSFILL